MCWPHPTDVGFALIAAVFALYYGWAKYVEHRWPLQHHRDED